MGISDIGLQVQRVDGIACMPEAHRHAEIELNFIVRGGLRYWLGGGLVTLRAGSLSAFWAAYPHRVVADTDDLEFHWMTVPLAVFLSWNFPRTFVDTLMTGAFVRQEKVASIEAEKPLWETWARTFQTGKPSGFALDVLRWEVRARLGRFALEAGVLKREKLQSRAAGLTRGVAAMVRHIGEHFREPVTVAGIAARAGLNPNYATAAFKQAFGLGIKDYLNRQRVAEAQRLLLSSDATVLEIGYQCGFTSPSRFHVWFQRLTGTSPQQYRRASG